MTTTTIPYELNKKSGILDVGHYIHSEAAELVATETRAFIEIKLITR